MQLCFYFKSGLITPSVDTEGGCLAPPKKSEIVFGLKRALLARISSLQHSWMHSQIYLVGKYVTSGILSTSDNYLLRFLKLKCAKIKMLKAPLKVHFVYTETCLKDLRKISMPCKRQTLIHESNLSHINTSIKLSYQAVKLRVLPNEVCILLLYGRSEKCRSGVWGWTHLHKFLVLKQCSFN